eukprot:COSAG02_NODE_4601_length_5177_cov_7.402718_1_plen_56_part_10
MMSEQDVRLMRSPVISPGRNIPTACKEIVLAMLLHSMPRALSANGVEVMTTTLRKY